MSRYGYMDLLESDNSVGVNIYDPLSLDFSDFPWLNGWSEYAVTMADIRKFYRVSNSFYETPDYSDILLTINNIADPWELTPGTIIYIPNKAELDSYLLKKRK